MGQSSPIEEREFISAAAAVYAWISWSDGEVTKSEVSSFVDYLNSSRFVTRITEEEFSEVYSTLIEAFANDFDDGRARAQMRIEAFVGDSEKSRELIQLARKAMLADEKGKRSERLVIAEIEEILRIQLQKTN